ncbi:MAG TPA: MFS transporter [Gemmatimonadales bacterium]|jgi:sugar phosphate permease|nr:MFS transporter [Gemmatimonadales bacterium]
MTRMTRRPHYAWIVLAVTFVALLAGAGIRATPSVLIIPLEQEFGWSRSTISLAISVNIFLYGLMGPFAGGLMQRLGVRRTTMGALLLLAAGVALATRVNRPWQLVLDWGILVGAGSGMVALVLGATIVNRWFRARRGLAMGLLTASTATGQLVFLPLLASVIERHGWRAAVLIVAGAAALAVPIVALLLRERPGDLGLGPFGADPDEPRNVFRPAGGPSPARLALGALAQGARSRDFWLLFATFFICGASTNGLIGTHLIPAAHDHGIPEVRAASLLALMGVFDLVGTTGAGWLTDRWSSRHLLAWYYGLRGLSLFFLPFALGGPEVSLWAFAVWYGLDWVATVPPTLRLTTDAFGTERAPIVFGWIAVGHQIGAALTAFSAGWIRTAFGDYQPAFWGSGGLCLVAALLALQVGRRPARMATAGAGAVA